MKKLAFFKQKDRLTPFEKCDFSNLIFFFQSKKVSFYLDHYLTIFLVLFKGKTNNEKNGIF